MFKKWNEHQSFKNWKKTTVGIFVVLFSIVNLFCQINYGQEFDFNDGLPSEITRKTFIDNEGTVWIGTDAGLGIFPKNNLLKNNIAKRLGSSQVWDICAHNGLIYFATYDSGLFVFHFKTGKLLKHFSYQVIPKIRKFKSIDNEQYIVSNKGIYKINRLNLIALIRKHPFANDTNSVPMDIFKWKNQLYISYFHDEALLVFQNNQWEIATNKLGESLKVKGLKNRYKSIMSSGVFKNKLICSTGDSRFFTIDENDQIQLHEFTNKFGSNFVIWDIKESQGHLYMAVGNTENFEQGLLYEFDDQESSPNVKMSNLGYFLWSLTIDPFSRGIWASSINHGVFFYPNLEHRVKLPTNCESYHESKNYEFAWENNLLYFKKLVGGTWQNISLKENIRKVLEFENAIIIESDDGVYISDFPNKLNPKLIFKNVFEDVFIQNNILYAVNFFGPIWSYDLHQKTVLNHVPQKYKNFHSTSSNDVFTILHSENQGYFIMIDDMMFPLNFSSPISKLNLKFYISGTTMFIHEGNILYCCEINLLNKQLNLLGTIQLKDLFPQFKIEWIQGTDHGLWMGNSLIALQTAYNQKNKQLELIKQFYLGFSKEIKTIDISNSHILINRTQYVHRIPIKSNFSSNIKPLKLKSEIERNQSFYHFPVFDQGQNDHFALDIDDYLYNQYYLYEVKIANSDSLISKRYFSNENGFWFNNLERDLYEVKINAYNQSMSFPLLINNPIFKRSEFWIYVFASMIILFFILYTQQKNSYLLQQKILSLELSTIRSNMNPHFVFNVMNFVQAMIVKSDQKKALKATSELAHLNRLFLETTNKETISLKNELNLARKYINLEKLRFESDKTFDFTISVEKNIDANAWFVPPLILQPLLENAVKHGVLLLENKLGKIKIYVLQIAPNEIDIIVQNTGQGETFKRIGGTGIGQKLVIDRILLLNRKFANEYFAQFTSNFDGNFYNCHLTIKKLT